MSKKKTTKKQSKKLVKITSPVKKDEAFFVAAELADDKQIVDEVMGGAVKTMVYEYENESDETVYGLAYQGVRESVRVINRMKDSGHRIQVSDKPPIIQRDIIMQGEKGVEVQVYAVDLESGGGSWGLKFEPWNKVINSKEDTSSNRFAIEKALSKAQRNAMFNLLPANLIENMIKKFVKEAEKVEKIEAPKNETRHIEPKPSDENKMYKSSLKRASEIKADEKALKEALKKIDNMPISSRQRCQIRRKINTYLKKINEQN